jgi:hypothetical protein
MLSSGATTFVFTPVPAARLSAIVRRPFFRRTSETSKAAFCGAVSAAAGICGSGRIHRPDASRRACSVRPSSSTRSMTTGLWKIDDRRGCM